VLCYGGGGRRRRSPGYRIKNKNPTQRCGEKGSKRESAAKSKWKTRTGENPHQDHQAEVSEDKIDKMLSYALTEYTVPV